jgi:hypothetical protein
VAGGRRRTAANETTTETSVQTLTE